MSTQFDPRMAMCYREVEADDRALQLFDHVIREVNVTRRSHPWTDLGVKKWISKWWFPWMVYNGKSMKIPKPLNMDTSGLRFEKLVCVVQGGHHDLSPRFLTQRPRKRCSMWTAWRCSRRFKAPLRNCAAWCDMWAKRWPWDSQKRMWTSFPWSSKIGWSTFLSTSCLQMPPQGCGTTSSRKMCQEWHLNLLCICCCQAGRGSWGAGRRTSMRSLQSFQRESLHKKWIACCKRTRRQFRWLSPPLWSFRPWSWSPRPIRPDPNAGSFGNSWRWPWSYRGALCMQQRTSPRPLLRGHLCPGRVGKGCVFRCADRLQGLPSRQGLNLNLHEPTWAKGFQFCTKTDWFFWAHTARPC